MRRTRSYFFDHRDRSSAPLSSPASKSLGDARNPSYQDSYERVRMPVAVFTFTPQLDLRVAQEIPPTEDSRSRFRSHLSRSDAVTNNTCMTRLPHEILARGLPCFKKLKNGSRKCTCVETKTLPDSATDLVLPSLCHFSVLSLNKRSPSNAELELGQGIGILMFYVVGVFGRS